MADYKCRKHVIFTDDTDKFYPADSVFTGAFLNGRYPLERLNVMVVDANDKRLTPEINIEPLTLIAGLSEV